MCGAAQTKEYAEELQQKFKTAHPDSITTGAMSHEALVEVVIRLRCMST